MCHVLGYPAAVFLSAVYSAVFTPIWTYYHTWLSIRAPSPYEISNVDSGHTKPSKRQYFEQPEKNYV